MCSKVVGIIGGMGPEATVDLMSKIIRATPAVKDQEHIRVLVDNNPKIPPRVEAIMGKDESPNPGPVMAEMASSLEKSGADFLVIACNTAHYFLPYVLEAVNIPVLNMIEETAEALKKDGIKNVVLLATMATLHTKLYEKALSKRGINLLLPEPSNQEKVLHMIASIKAGNFSEAERYTAKLIQDSLDMGADAIVLGCTELPLVFNKVQNPPLTIYDPGEIIAQAIVKKASQPKTN